MADDERDANPSTSRVTPSTPGPSSGQVFRPGDLEQARRDFILNSPQYVAPPSQLARLQADSTKALSVARGTATTAEDRRALEEWERRQLQQELDAVQAEVRGLEVEHARVMGEQANRSQIEESTRSAAQTSKVGRGISMVGIDGEEEDLESLEAMLRQMDDGALSALLTQSAKSPALEALMQHLPKDGSPTVLAPARSAGIEGTGSGVQLDEEADRLAHNTGADLDLQIEDALRERLKRSDELARALAMFTGLRLDHVETTELVRKPGNYSQVLRHIKMGGTLTGDLGVIVLDMDVEDYEARNDLPQIVTLDVEVDDAVFFAIGATQIKSYVEKVNLPALLLAIRTIVPLAHMRYRFFVSIAELYPDLAQAHIRHLESEGVTLNESNVSHESLSGNTPLSILVNPNVMETFVLRNSVGAQLSVRFHIEFNQFGHASPRLAVTPFVPPNLIANDSVAQLLDELPTKFTHLCAHRPNYIDSRTALAATIDAFFAL